MCIALNVALQCKKSFFCRQRGPNHHILASQIRTGVMHRLHPHVLRHQTPRHSVAFTHTHTHRHTYIAQLVASYAAEIPDPDLHPVPEIRPLDPVVAADLTTVAEESFWGKDLPAGRWLHRGLESSLGRLTHRHVLPHASQAQLWTHVQRHPGAAPPRGKNRVQSIIQYNTIQHNTIQYNTIQYNTIQYNTIQYDMI